MRNLCRLNGFGFITLDLNNISPDACTCRRLVFQLMSKGPLVPASTFKPICATVFLFLLAKHHVLNRAKKVYCFVFSRQSGSDRSRSRSRSHSAACPAYPAVSSTNQVPCPHICNGHFHYNMFPDKSLVMLTLGPATWT